MNPRLDPGPDDVEASDGDQRQFVLLDDADDRTDRGRPESDVLTAVLGPAAVRVQPLSPSSTTAGTGGLEVLVTVANVDNETSYVPALEAAGYVLTLRVPGHRVLTLPGCGVRVHVRDDDDPAAGGRPVRR